MQTHDTDVVVVGARAAGAATAMLLARAGLDVVVVDRARAGSDT
ncbi:MAG: FAD-dependent oxidoreductase, partial [Acidimicrobiales bacterium]